MPTRTAAVLVLAVLAPVTPVTLAVGPAAAGQPGVPASQQAEVPLSVADLPEGSPPRRLAMAGRTIHLPGGRTLTFRWPGSAQPAVLGRVGKQVIVKARLPERRTGIFAVSRNGSVRKVGPSVYDQYFGNEYRLAPATGRVYVAQNVDGPGQLLLQIRVRDGKVLRRHTTRDGWEFTILDAGRRGALLTGGPARGLRLVMWRHGGRLVTTYRQPRGTATFADLSHDLLAVERRAGTKLVRLSAPGQTIWTVAERTTPRQLSPDGSLLLAAYGEDRLAEVRDARTGESLLRLSTVWPERLTQSQWDGNRGFLAVATVRLNAQRFPELVIRCDLGGACERVTGTAKRASLPYQPGEVA